MIKFHFSLYETAQWSSPWQVFKSLETTNTSLAMFQMGCGKPKAQVFWAKSFIIQNVQWWGTIPVYNFIFCPFGTLVYPQLNAYGYAEHSGHSGQCILPVKQGSPKHMASLMNLVSRLPPPVILLNSFHPIPVYKLNFPHSPEPTNCICKYSHLYFEKDYMWSVRLYLCSEEGRGQGARRQRRAVESNGDKVTSRQEEGGGRDFQAFGFSTFQKRTIGQAPPLWRCCALWPHSLPLTRWQV